MFSCCCQNELSLLAVEKVLPTIRWISPSDNLTVFININHFKLGFNCFFWQWLKNSIKHCKNCKDTNTKPNNVVCYLSKFIHDKSHRYVPYFTSSNSSARVIRIILSLSQYSATVRNTSAIVASSSSGAF